MTRGRIRIDEFAARVFLGRRRLSTLFVAEFGLSPKEAARTMRFTHALIDFLVSAFGFARNVVYEDGGLIAHAQLDWPEGGGIMLGDGREGGEWNREPGTAGAYVVTADIDALHARAVAAGAEILEGPVERDYGSRDIVVRDPEGNLWSFGTYRGAPRKG